MNEQIEPHTRLLKCALLIESSRAWWAHVDPGGPAPDPQRAFEEYWFGPRSLPQVRNLISNLRLRYDAYPHALTVLHEWEAMSPDTRRVVCHWHLQLADPLYRRFTGEYLLQRRERLRAEATIDATVRFVEEHAPGYALATRRQFASKLLSAAHEAGLVEGVRDPRPLRFPRVPDDALTYALYLLRSVRFAGTLLDNPYLRSVGLYGSFLDDRLRLLPSVEYRRVGSVADFGWRHSSLAAWAAVSLGAS